MHLGLGFDDGCLIIWSHQAHKSTGMLLSDFCSYLEVGHGESLDLLLSHMLLIDVIDSCCAC